MMTRGTQATLTIMKACAKRSKSFVLPGANMAIPSTHGPGADIHVLEPGILVGVVKLRTNG